MRLLLALAAALLLPFAAQAQLQTYATQPLVIETAQGAQTFTVELAITPQQQEQGLMYRRTLAPDAGMLFVFPETQQAVFWMKNTLIPLDMIFIAADGTIADIHERAVPLSLDNIVGTVPVKAVLEVNGGTASRLGIKIGDKVKSATLGAAG